MNERGQAALWVQTAYAEGWAIGQFNVSNLETVQAIVAAAERTRAPVMLGTSMGTIRHAGLPYLAALAAAARELATVPIMLHLDHGPDLATITECINRGYDSVMIDGSGLPYEENVALVRRVVALARPHGVAVEAQIGETWEEEGDGQHQRETAPAEAQAFVKDTGVDYVALSIGNTPGETKGQAAIDLDLLGAIVAATGVPAVLHDGTSVSPSTVRVAMGLGVAKINIDTAIREAVTDTLVALYAKPDPVRDPRVSFRDARAAAEAVVEERIRLFGSAGRIK